MTLTENYAEPFHLIVLLSILLIYIIVEEYRVHDDVVVQRWKSLFSPTDTRCVKALTERIDAPDNLFNGRHR